MLNLDLSLQELFRLAHRQIRPRSPIPEIDAEFFPFAGLNHTARLRKQRLHIRVSDLCSDAPPQALHSLALLLLGKLYRRPIEESHRENYRRYILQQEVQEKARLARVARGRKPRTFHAAGRYHNLETSFERLNREYFAGSLERVSLSWSTRRSRHILGRYDSAHRAIYISRILDTADTPAYVVDYVLYHEMLHVRHQVRSDGCRLVVHSAEFRRQEQHFNHYSAAKKWLDRL